MLRLPSICPFCEARALLRQSRSWRPSRDVLQHRAASTLQKRKPSRMTLSPQSSVARGPPQHATSSKPAGAGRKDKGRNSPFGGMNVITPPRAFQERSKSGTKRNVSAAEQRRATRFAKQKPKPERERREPMRALKMQRALSQVSYERRGRVKQALAERDSFDDFDLLPVIRESISHQALHGLADVSPTPIQRLAIPALLGTPDGTRRRRRKEAAPPETEKTAPQHFLLAAETGSGKTLAYLLPILDALKRAEKAEAEAQRTDAARQQREEHEQQQRRHANQAFELAAPAVDEPHPSTGRPRAIILLPTSELVAQVGALVKSLSHTVKFRAALLSSAFTATVIRSRLFSPAGVDLVIATPHLLSSITDSDPNVLSRVTHLVIDEADSLLDRSFSPLTSALVDRASPSLRQLVLCSATIPRSLDTYLHRRFPDLRRLVTPNLHAIPRRVQLSVVDVDKVPFQGNRDLACAQTVWDIGKEAATTATEEAGEERERGPAAAGKKIVVFVNEREKTVELAKYLRSKGIDATALSRDADERRQSEVLAEFTGLESSSSSSSSRSPPSASSTAAHPHPPPPADPAAEDPNLTASRHHLQQQQQQQTHHQRNPASTPRHHHLPNTKVLVTTDLGSRGIDTLAVRHVILYHVPHTSIDFIHRLGRVGRMGRRGRGVVLVGRGDRRDVVREVREGMFRGQALI